MYSTSVRPRRDFARMARIVSFALLSCLLVGLLSGLAAAQTFPITHIVFMIKENRSFDNMFGQFPGVGTWGATSGPISTGQVLPLQHSGDVLSRDLCHTWNCNIVAFDGGRLDKWDVTVGDPTFACNLNGDYLCYSQYQQSDLPNYYTYAQAFTLAVQYFSAIHATSNPNHMYTVAATSGNIIGQAHNLLNSSMGEAGCQSDPSSGVNVLVPNGNIVTPFPCFDFATLADSLDNAGLSWTYYTPAGSSYNPLEEINHLRNNPTLWNAHIKDVSNFATDASSGNLPSVSWIVTGDNYSEHPPNSVCAGENWDVQQLNAVMQGDWDHTAVFLYWDDSGGFYDHIAWPKFDQFGPGPRVPLVIISPYAKAGTLDTTVLEHSSMIKFAEKIYGLPPIHERDNDNNQNSGDATEAFNFSQSPLPPLTLNTRSCSPISNTELSFPPQAVGTSSAVKTITVTNYGTTTLTVTGITSSSADFPVSKLQDACPNPLPPSGTKKFNSCVINVNFKPTQAGTRTGNVTVTTDQFGAQVTAVTGQGTNVILNPPTLTFGTVGNKASKTLTATLQNAGTTTLNITNITIPTLDYSETDNCIGNLSAGQSCTLTVTFAPKTPGTRYAALTITDSDASSPQVLNLTGVGTTLTIAPTLLTFPTTSVGLTSAAKAVTLTNNGQQDLTINSITTTGTLQQDGSAFSVQSSTCGTSLAAGATCTVNVVFMPNLTGFLAGTLYFNDSETSTSPQSVTLSGNGNANPVPWISDPLVPPSAAPGGAQFTLTVNGSNFVSGSQVKWNAQTLSTTFVNSRQLTATVPAANIANAGSAIVSVFNPAPLGGASQPAVFEVTSPNAIQLKKTDFSGFSAPLGMARGDFNGDGLLDLAVVNSGANTVSILLGTTGGRFTLKATANTGIAPTSVAVGDFNGDGKPDLAIATLGNATIQPAVTILIGNGDGTFAPGPGASPQVGAGPVAIGAADLQKNGWIDLVTVNNIENLGSMLQGNGDGTFSAIATGPNTGNAPVALAVGDFTSDGILDLAIVNNVDNTFYILPGNGDGSFTWLGETATGNAPSGIAAADLNGDGKLDLVVTNKADNTASSYIGDGSGGFTAKATVATGTGPNAVAVGDFNGDGKVDIATANSTGNSVSFIPGNGDGTFGTRLDGTTGNGPTAIVTGDFNRDGRLDVAVTATSSNIVSVLLQGSSAGGPQVRLNPTSLKFPTQLINSTSAAQTVTVTNSGNATLSITSIAVTGTNSTDYSQTNTCGTTLNAGASCTISVTFTPAARGSRSASITLTDNASNSPQNVALTGIGTVVQLVPPSVNFGSQKVGTMSTPQNITVTNTGGQPLQLTSLTFTGTNTGDFTKSTTCSNTVPLPPGASCTITVTFQPTATGARSAVLNVNDNGGGSPQLVPLSGTGT